MIDGVVCFIIGTKVKNSDGEKNIEKFELGDEDMLAVHYRRDRTSDFYT